MQKGDLKLNNLQVAFLIRLAVILIDYYFVQFLLWEGDEEFAPSSQILFSDNFPAGFHAEDLVVVCDVLITILKNLQ